MTENLTESFAIWPWAAWLLLAGLCFAAELFRRDHWAEVALVGCMVAAAASVLVPSQVGLQVAAAAVGTALATLLARPWAAGTGPVDG